MSASFKSQTEYIIGFIGLGHRSIQRALDIVEQNPLFKLVAACDKDSKAAQRFFANQPKVPCLDTIENLLKH